MIQKGAFVVTGASRGLGRAIAETAYRAGFPVALIARSKDSLAAVKSEIQKPGGPAVSIHAVDLTQAAAVVQEFGEIQKAHGSIRALINNAATWMGTTSVEELEASDIQKSLDLNFFSAFHATQAVLKLAGIPPRNELAIVNIGATASLDAWVEVLPFCIGKGALRALSRALARDLGPKGVHVAHLVIDGILDNERTRKLNPRTEGDRFISSAAVVESVVQVALQERSCWTMEWDVRPFNESW